MKPIETNPDYWDCECAHDYIQPKTLEMCPQCGAWQDEQPDSRQLEIDVMTAGGRAKG